MKNADKGGHGTVTVAEDVIAACVREAVSGTVGVYDLAGGGIPNAFSQNILGKDARFKGIKIAQGDGGIALDVQIVVEYGVKIPEVAWNFQRRVKSEVESMMTDTTVTAVNVAVQGVHAKGADAEGSGDVEA